MIWPASNPLKIDYEALSGILMKPDDQMPVRMVDALYFVHEMATPEQMDTLIEATKVEGIDLDQDPDTTPADVAAQVWLKAPTLLESMHGEVLVKKPRRFLYFKSVEPRSKTFAVPSDAVVKALQDGLDAWFDEHKRGTSSKVRVFDHGDKVSFLVRHGMPFKREGSMKGPQSETVFYRPEIHDVLVYDRIINELAIHAGSMGEWKLYLAAFGKHLFGDSEYFPDEDKFTLDPLKSGNPDCLACDDIEGVDFVKLVELHRAWGGPYGDIEIRKSKDYMASLAARKQAVPPFANLTSAVFSVKFSHARAPRSAMIRPPNVSSLTRDEDGLLFERWAKARGFIAERKTQIDAISREAMGGS
jgi:hypothetical protein